MPAFAPTFLNVSMIGFALFAAPYFHPPVLALAWAVTVGGVLQLAYQLPHLKKIGMLVLPRINLKDAGAMRVVKQMGPAILGVSVSQISSSSIPSSPRFSCRDRCHGCTMPTV